MSTPLDSRLERLLGGAELASLRERLRRSLASRDPNERGVTLRVIGLSPRDSDVLASLMGKRPIMSKSVSVDIDLIDAALLRAGIASSLRHALEQLDGPIVNTRAVRAKRAANWADLAAGARHSGLAGYLLTSFGLGILKRLANSDLAEGLRLRERADIVLKCLPAAGLPRAQLAAQTLGDAHALDAGKATASLVLAALRQHESQGVRSEATDAVDTENDEGVRAVWARAGVLINELARPALFLNLVVAETTDLLSPAGEPGYVSLRVLLRSPPPWVVDGCKVYVCENPNLIAIAADRLGPRCPPLVCTDGMPAAAQRALLGQLAQAGARLLYHGDFDWPGIRIANHVMRSFGAQAWRFSSADYGAAIEKHGRSEHCLAGPEVEAHWDSTLSSAMRKHGLAFAEEGLSDELVADLERDAASDDESLPDR